MRLTLVAISVLLVGLSFQMGGIAETREQATLNDTEISIDEQGNDTVSTYYTKPMLRSVQTGTNSASLLAYENDWFPGVAIGGLIQLFTAGWALFKVNNVVQEWRSR